MRRKKRRAKLLARSHSLAAVAKIAGEPPQCGPPRPEASRRLCCCFIACAFNRADCVELFCRQSRKRVRRKVSNHLALLLICALTLGALSSGSEANEPSDRHHLSIQTKQGVFRGLLLSPSVSDWPAGLRSFKTGDDPSDFVVGFLGVRYASAPIKRLRFMPPTAYTYSNQNAVHNMQKFGPICRQRFPVDVENLGPLSESNTTNKEDTLKLQLRLMRRLMPSESFAQMEPLMRRLSAFEQSEDCLNLNIYAPLEAFRSSAHLNGDKATVGANWRALPVLVILHADSFDYGSGSAINALKFVHRTRLIVVTFNFRLNVLGFPPKLTGGAVRANLGLMDQVAALHWIRDNIEAFGGAPDSVTLMASKRGAIFVNLLMLSPLAKGLFARAIMEDGSALTPLVANHITTASLANPIANNPALLHLRLLARLCECPVYLAASTHIQPTSKSATTNTSNNNNNNTVQITVQQHLSNSDITAQHNGAFLALESKTNALTIECLRQKPIEQIMQRVPLDLLHFDQATGDISMPVRWLKSLAQVAQTAASFGFSARWNQTSNALIEPSELNKLVLAVTRLQLEPSGGSAPELEASGGGDLDELFGGIFAQTSATMQPTFGPILDGTIVLNEDLSAAMLKPNSLFAQRDLLIGLSQPAIIRHLENVDDNRGNKTNNNNEYEEFKFRPDRLIAERFNSRLLQVGLTGEQAVEAIGVFVRSFYRHHNQEIVNSIMNYYLNGLNWNHLSAYRRLQKSRLDSATREETMAGARNDSDYNERQLLVLDSVLDMFQDALTSVPVLKTALIHSTKQLDSLVDAFVGHEFDRWTSLQVPSSSSSSPGSYRLFSGTSSGSSSNQQHADHKSLVESFTKFARSLFADPNWPLELRSSLSNAPTPNQPKSTYLYQIDSRTLANDVQNLIVRLNNGKLNAPDWLQQAVSDTLGALVDKLKGEYYRPALSLACGVDFGLCDRADSSSSLLGRLLESLCDRMSQLVASFVSTGKMSLKASEPRGSAREDSLANSMARYESQCVAPYSPDHHTVLPSDSDNLYGRPAEPVNACRRELESLALRYIIEELGSNQQRSSDADTNTGAKQWTPFNIFTQQVASLASFKAPPLSMLAPVSQDDSTASQSHTDPKSTLLARSSFWLNFIPALNCTKTLPIVPNNLLASASSSSTLLLNLNLQFSCQQGARTANHILELIASSIKQQLELRISQWHANHSSGSSSSSVNFGTSQNQLAMPIAANMSQSDEGLNDQQDLLGAENRGLSANYSLKPSQTFESELQLDAIRSTDKVHDARKAFIDLRTKYIGMVLLVCSSLIGITLIVGACSVFRRRHQKNRTLKRRQTDSQQIEADSVIDKEDALQQQQQQQQKQVSAGQLDCNHHVLQNGLVHDGNQSFVEQSVGDHATQAGDNCTGITLALDVADYGHEQTSHVQLACAAGNNNNHVCAVNNQADNVVCWTGDSGDLSNGFLNGTMSLCRSHSSLSGANELFKREQPIMMPILNAPINDFQNRVTFKQDYSDSNIDNHYGGSSSETQVQSSGSSTTKKRVKIRDPFAMENNDSLYCPIHHNQSNSMLNMTSSGYFVQDGTTFVTTDANGVNLWSNLI